MTESELDRIDRRMLWLVLIVFAFALAGLVVIVAFLNDREERNRNAPIVETCVQHRITQKVVLE